MRIINFVVCLSLVSVGFPMRGSSLSPEKGLFESLTEQEMTQIVGGSSVAQIEILNPPHDAWLAGLGSVYYNVQFWNVEGTADLVLFIANSSEEQIEIARVTGVTGSGSTSGSFASSFVRTSGALLVAELVDPAGDPYDSCSDGTETVYGRATIFVSGNGT